MEIAIASTYGTLMLVLGFIQTKQSLSKKDIFHIILGGICFIIGVIVTAALVINFYPMYCEYIPNMTCEFDVS